MERPIAGMKRTERRDVGRGLQRSSLSVLLEKMESNDGEATTNGS
jgi:hypothetical protein